MEIIYLVWWVFSIHLKNIAQVQLDHEPPKVSGWHIPTSFFETTTQENVGRNLSDPNCLARSACIEVIHKFTSWWFSTVVWKIGSSNWIMNPQVAEIEYKNVSKLPPAGWVFGYEYVVSFRWDSWVGLGSSLGWGETHYAPRRKKRPALLPPAVLYNNVGVGFPCSCQSVGFAIRIIELWSWFFRYSGPSHKYEDLLWRKMQMNKQAKKRMNPWMNETMNDKMAEWLNEWLNEWMNEWMYECMNVWMYECMNVWIEELYNAQTNKRTNEFRTQSCHAFSFSRNTFRLAGTPISTHRIHVWYIYLHLVDFYGKCRDIHHTWILWGIVPTLSLVPCSLLIWSIFPTQQLLTGLKWIKKYTWMYWFIIGPRNPNITSWKIWPFSCGLLSPWFFLTSLSNCWLWWCFCRFLFQPKIFG